MLRTGNDRQLFREYYIVFKDAERLSPWLKLLFTKKGFSHCDVYMAYEGGTMCVSQTVWNVDVYTWPCDVNLLAEWLSKQEGHTVVYLPTILNVERKIKCGTIIPSCVALCQNITGKTFHAVTPPAYFRALLKSGGHLMGGIMGKPKVDKEQQRALQEQREKNARMEREEQERTSKLDAQQKDLTNRQRKGRRSLLGSGDELGII